MLFQLITELDQIFTERLHSITAEKTGLRRRMTHRHDVLREILLLLTESEPADVEVVPELEATRVLFVVVTQDSYVSQGRISLLSSTVAFPAMGIPLILKERGKEKLEGNRRIWKVESYTWCTWNGIKEREREKLTKIPCIGNEPFGDFQQ